MNYVYPPAPLEPWNWVYTAAVLMAALMLFGALFVTAQIDYINAPRWMTIPAGLGVLYVISIPWNLLILYALAGIMKAMNAPTDAIMLMVTFTIACWFLACSELFHHRRSVAIKSN